ncbi:MAG: hypothetical protein M8357_11205 [Desulfobulbaceae bacterium]|nr:hypothetical protein [Desulfobulbaceae bacterium]
MTVVFDKGMNSEDNIAAIDARPDINFITTYSTYYSEHLLHVDPDKFKPVETRRNQELSKDGKDDDRLKAWRTGGEYWGRLRTVVVTYNPLTATKQRYGSFPLERVSIVCCRNDGYPPPSPVVTLSPALGNADFFIR